MVRSRGATIERLMAFPPPGSSAARLEEIEKREILAALERTNWHQGRTAELLGISPSTLYRRLRAYNLSKRQVVAQQRTGR